VICWSNGRVALGRSVSGPDSHGSQPFVDRASGSVIALEGRIDNLDELRGALGAPFLIAGALKSVYDVGLYVLFRNVGVEGERTAKPAAAG